MNIIIPKKVYMAYELLKSSSGIEGFDSILRGGYPEDVLL
jgi:hypothetical protein